MNLTNLKRDVMYALIDDALYNLFNDLQVKYRRDFELYSELDIIEKAVTNTILNLMEV